MTDGRVRLQFLGAFAAYSGAGDVTAAIAQPKRLALLIWLELSRPRGLHSRDIVCGLLWPESPNDKARAALRQLLLVLRRDLGEDVFVSEGELVGINAKRVTSDAGTVLDALEHGDDARAVAAFAGELLPGLPFAEGDHFERWLEQRRSDLRRAVVQAAWREVERAESRSDFVEALRLAEWAVAADQEDEQGLRRLLTLQAQHGDRTAALRAYRRYADHLRQDWDAEPEEQTRRLCERIKDGDLALAPVDSVRRGRADAQSLPEADREGGHTPHAQTRRHRWAVLGGGAVALLLLSFLGWYLTSRFPPSRTSGTAAAPKSIAVLPLVNVGGDSTQDYYADGVSEELANALGRVPGLRVAARTSTFAFKGRRDLDVAEVGEKLNVGVVLQGTVRRLGDRVKLSVQLTDTKERVELWSGIYDQAVQDVFAIQDSIAQAIVRQLTLTLRVQGRGRAPDPQAHDLYLLGLAQTNRDASEGALRSALSYYRRALEKDPDYVDSWLGVAHSYSGLTAIYQSARAVHDSIRTAAREALARDSLAGEAYTLLAGVASDEGKFDEADRLFLRAIELSPNSTGVHLQYGAYSCSLGRIDQGLAAVARGVELDPLSFFPRWARCWCLYAGRRYDAAIAEKDANPILASTVYVDDWAAAAMRELGRYGEALQMYEQAQALSEQPLHGHAITYARMGRTKEAREILARLTTYARGHYVNPIFVAFIQASLGENDKAFESLDRALADGPSGFLTLRTSPELDPIRSDPRYAALVKRIGLPEMPR